MNQIKIDCFATDQSCQLVSLDQTIEVNDPSEKEAIIEISNQGPNRCFAKMKVQSLTSDDDLQVFELSISREKQILFNSSFANFSKTEINLGEILANSSATYVLQMDLLDLLLEEKSVLLNFTLVFDFTCEDSIEVTNYEDKISVMESTPNEKAVLSATSSTEIVDLSSKSVQEPVHLLFLLPILFVIIFFVIMKLIHGQKKKKKTKIGV